VQLLTVLCGYRAACFCCLQGQVYAMAVAAPALFTAGQDCSIRVWNYNEQAGIFMSAVSGAAAKAFLQ
jgi:type IV secretory pathway VirB9-like protein